MAANVQIQLFGGLHVMHNGELVSGFISNKVPALLVYLAMTRRPHLRSALATLLWSELPDADARNNLRQALSNLRQLFDDHLLITRETVAFNSAAPYILDCEAFEQRIHEAANAVALETRITALRDAVALYQGDFLNGFLARDAPLFDEWTIPLQARFRELALQALHTLTNLYLAGAEYTLAIDSTTRLLALDSWREEAHRQLMLALVRTGQRSAALAQYEACRRILNHELGVEPAAETTAFYERIRKSRRHVHIPPADTPFIGRTAELAHVSRLLADPACRLVTIIGPGGSGKTRLAREVAARTAEWFLHGACMTLLASTTSSHIIPSVIAETLGVSLSGTAEPRDQVLAYLGDKELLLVLDNLEHLPDADELVARLIAACPELRLLITSRERLNLHGERLVELPGLEQPPDTDAGALLDYSAPQLFLTCAEAVLPSFVPTKEDARAIVQICRFVSGLPLAIELAAAWVRSMSCWEIAEEIQRGIAFLATAQKNVPARHRSLLAAFEHSWTLLNQEEQQAFARLALFRGGCDREAALAVVQCRPPALAALCDKSLLRRLPSGRYVVHELLRQYGEQQLHTNPSQFHQTALSHCQHYLNLLAAAEDALNDARQNDARPMLTAEIDNIRAAWGWAVANQHVATLAPALEGMRVLLEISGWYAEGVELFRTAANGEHASHGVSTLYGRLLIRQAWFHHRLDQFDQARALIEQGMPLLRTIQSSLVADEGLCFHCLANASRAMGEFARANQYARQSLACYRTFGNPRQVAAALNVLGVALNEQGEFDEARQLHIECLALKRTIGDQRGIAISLVNLGNSALGQGNYVEARPIEQEALDAFRAIGYPMGEVVALNNLGVALHRLGECVEAQSILEECLNRCRELGHRHVAAHALASLGGVVAALGEQRQAWRHIQEALRTAQEIRSLSATLFGLVSAAALLADQAQPEQSAEIASFVVQHPAANRETQRHAEQLLEKLAGALPAPALVDMQEHRQRLTIDDIVARILHTAEGQLV